MNARASTRLCITAGAVAIASLSNDTPAQVCGAQWQNEIGQPGMNDRINALAVFDDGTGSGPVLIAGGFFTSAGGTPVPRVAKWIAPSGGGGGGGNWQPIGTTLPISMVLALALYDPAPGKSPGPQLYAAGNGATAPLVRWTGSEWVAVPNSPTTWLGELHVHDMGDGPELFISGGFINFQTIDGQRDYIARWNGTHWRAVGNEIFGFIHEFAAFEAPGSEPALYGVGGIGLGSPMVIGFGKFDGVSWSGVAGGFNTGAVYTMKLHNDGSGPALFIGGDFTVAGGTSTNNGGIPANRIVKWNGQPSGGWSALGAGMNADVLALAVFDEDGDAPGSNPPMLFAAGEFTSAGGAPANRIAKWNGTSWSALDGGTNGIVRALHTLADGRSLFAAGDFTAADDQVANRIAAWGCPSPVPGDINGDGVVNVSDLLAVINAWGPCPAPPQSCPADVAPPPNGDGVVNVSDLLMVINNWG